MYRILIVIIFLLQLYEMNAQIPTNGLVAYYPFNGNANDVSGNRSPGIPVGGVSYTNGANGLSNHALLLDGVSGYMDLGGGLNFSQSFSISFLAKTITNSGGNPAIISQGIGQLNQQMHIMLGASYMRFTFYENTPLDCSQNFPGLNEWGYWVCTYDEVTETRRMYLNGNLICNDTRTPGNSIGNTRIGTNTYDNPTNGFFHGAIDQVRIYIRALTDQEVNQLYEAEVSPADITTGLVAHYPFNGNANDESGNGSHCIPNGVILTADRFNIPDKAYDFNGSSYLDGGSSVPPTLQLTDAVTLSAWVNLNNNNNLYNRIISVGNQFYNTSGYELFFENNMPKAIFGGYGLDPASVTYNNTFQFNEWHNITYSADMNGLKLYLDGNLVATGPGGLISPPTLNEYIGHPFYIGKYLNSTYPSYFNGKLDDIRIYNRVLSSLEVAFLYQSEAPVLTLNSGLVAYYPFNGNINDESGNANHGINYNTSLAPDRNGNPNKAMQFDGVSSYILVANSASLETPQNGITIAAWAKYTEYNQGHSIVCKSDQSGTSPFQYRLGINYLGPFLGFQNTPGSWYDINPNNPIPINEWKYIVSTYDGSYAKFYIDGNLVSTTPFTGHIYPDSKAMEIGRDIHGGTEYFKGFLDEIKIFNRAISQQEVLSLYNNVVPPCGFLKPEIISSSLEVTTRPNGNIQLSANITTCPATNNIVEFKYWFDGQINNVVTVPTQRLNYLNFNHLIDCEDLINGLHQLNFQFKDVDNNLSQILIKEFSKTNVLIKEKIEPKLYITSGILREGEIQNISGKNFSNGGNIIVYLNSPDGKITIYENQIIYMEPGMFSLTLNTAGLGEGIYAVFAKDNATGKICPQIKFEIRNPVLRQLIIKKPSLSDVFYSTQTYEITWEDYVEKNVANGVSGTVTKKYKVEESYDGGSTWGIVSNNILCNSAIPGKTNVFTYKYINNSPAFFLPATVKFKITDIENPLNTNMSFPFILKEKPQTGFTATLQWDKSAPYYNAAENPIGLAADSTSRILLRLKRGMSNTKVVTQIKATIKPIESLYEGTTMLGRIMYATHYSEYSEEANLANQTSITVPIQSQDQTYYFWLVAPTDFIQDINSLKSERKIKVEFEILDSDNITELVILDDILIVRPPILFVHGLNSNSNAFNNTKYKVGNNTFYFDNDSYGKSATWKVTRRINIDGEASFSRNAEIILGKYDVARNLPNTFRGVLNEMHKLGFASNRVDYVCHSMGGSIARTIINKYSSEYMPTPSSESYYKNYGKGFINKLITINTPHNGSPIADILTLGLPVLTDIDNGIKMYLASNSIIGLANSTIANGFFKWDKNQNKYVASEAVNDLRGTFGGIRFKKTYVKNHLIGGDLFNGVTLNNVIDFFSSDYKPTLDLLVQLTHKPGQKNSNEILGKTQLVEQYFLEKFGVPKFFLNSDGIVSSLSQFPGFNLESIPDVDVQPDYYYPATNSFGFNRFHTSVTSDEIIGTRIFNLLNSPIESQKFNPYIEENTTLFGSDTYKSLVTSTPSIDSIISIIDTVKIVIEKGNLNTDYSIDSTINISLKLKDTLGFKKLQLIIQGQYYESFSKAALQIFNIKIQSNYIGKSQMQIRAMYDSSNYTIYHIDTMLINVFSPDTLKEFRVNPTSMILNERQNFNLNYNLFYNNYIATLPSYDDSIQIHILDKNVVKYDTVAHFFQAQDTGSTHAFIYYKGFVDTVYFFINEDNFYSKNICPNSTIKLPAQQSGSSYQWQIDRGNGFENLNSDSVHSNISSDTLIINSPPTNWRGYMYKCLISTGNIASMSSAYKLNFATVWNGAVDSSWHNPLNWSCSFVPDQYVDVVIPKGKQNYPTVSSNISVNGLKLENGSAIEVKPGVILDIKCRQN